MEHADLDSLINSAWDVGVVVCELRPTRQSVSETDDYDLTCSLSDLPRFVEVLFNIAKEQSFSFEIAQRKFAKTVIYVYAYDSQIKRKIEIWHALRLRRSGTDYSHVLLPSQLAAGFYGRFKVSPLWRLVILPVLFLARMSVGSNLDADDVRRVRLFLEGLGKVPGDLGAKNCVKSIEEQLLRLLAAVPQQSPKLRKPQ